MDVSAAELARLSAQSASAQQWGWALFWAFFAAGLLLLLAGVLCSKIRVAPEGGAGLLGRLLNLCAPHRYRFYQHGAIILLLLCAIAQQIRLDQTRGFIADQEKRYEEAYRKMGKDEALRTQYMYIPEGNALQYMSLNNGNVAADFVWLTSLQYISSSFRRGEKFDLLLRFYNTVLELDPHWEEPLVLGGKLLSALDPDRLKVEQFYVRCIIQNRDSWRLPYETGLLFVVPPLCPDLQKEYAARAVFWFTLALQRKSFPPKGVPGLNDMIARLSLESGYYQEAARLLYEYATNPHNPVAMRHISARDWLYADSLVRVQHLQALVDVYTRQRARPSALAEVFAPLPAERAVAFSQDAFGLPFDYDPATGQVTSRGVQARRAIQARAVISTLINLFRQNHAGQPPADLSELKDFVARYYRSPGRVPSAAVTEAIGSDLDPSRSPLGTWDYDPRTGEIKLPDFCNLDALYKNAGKLLEQDNGL